MTSSHPHSPLASEALVPERLSVRVEHAFWENGWLLDRGVVFDQSFVRLRRQYGTQPITETQIDEAVDAAGRNLILESQLQAPFALESSRFNRHLRSLLGLTVEEAAGAQVRFHELPATDRRAFLMLMRAPTGHAKAVPMGQGSVPIEGLLEDQGGTLVAGARRALLALFNWESLEDEGGRS